jgi:tRNA A-37 threonylcarbamoyl transferase component Bud32
VGNEKVQRVLIAGRYRLLHIVGSGGMGRVWLARDEMLHRDVAVKEILPPDWMTPAERDDLRRRTLREARTAARLNHPGVVKIWDVVYAEGSPWIVMEYVPSRSLHEIVEADGPLPPERVAEVGLKVLDALVAAHRARVLHRDVKPHNVLIADDGRVVLTDFGLATFDGDSAVTRQGMVMGSPQYVAPERARDGASTAEADMWSLGATLYAAVEGRSPFARATALATLTALATAPPDPPQRAGQLRAVLAGLLRKDPRQRFTADEVDRLLHEVLDPGTMPRPRLLRRPRRATRAPSSGEGPPVLPDGSGNPVMPAPGRAWDAVRLRGRRRLALLSAAVLAVVLTAIGSEWAISRGDARGGGNGGVMAPTPSGGATGGRTGTPSGRAAAAPPPIPCTSMEGLVTSTIPGGKLPPAIPGRGTLALESYYTWYLDPAHHFYIAVQSSWRKWTEGSTTCFGGTATRKTLSVTPIDRPKDAVKYFKSEKTDLMKRGGLPGYRHEDIRPILTYQGGARWDFVYVAAGGVPTRVVRTLETIEGRTFVVNWSSPDADFANSQADYPLSTLYVM